MQPDHEAHLDRIKTFISTSVDSKYRKGQAEHGGSLWEKKDLIGKAIEEALDQCTYLPTLKEQLEAQANILRIMINISADMFHDNNDAVDWYKRMTQKAIDCLGTKDDA